MPIHLSSASIPRRQFLKAAGAGILLFSRPSTAADSAAEEGDLVCLLNDTHIGEKQPEHSAVPAHLRQIVSDLTDRPDRPACVIINGDLALHEGRPGDYRHFARLIRPLQDAPIPVHLTLGNHDHRDTFFSILQEQQSEQPPVASRHISVVETRHARFFLLDSLHETLVTPGTLGPEQLRWLAAALDRFSSRPAVIVTHHNPRLGGDPKHFPGGLTDSRELWDILTPRRWVKAFIHGHIHHRSIAQHEGIHILNLPATSYVADPNESTTGWTAGQFTSQGVTLTTHTTDPRHPWNGQTTTLSWRT